MLPADVEPDRRRVRVCVCPRRPRFPSGTKCAHAVGMATTSAIPAPGSSRVRAGDLELIRYLDLKLAALGEPTSSVDAGFLELAGPLLRNHFQKDELLGWPLCPVDERIQTFLDEY